MRVYKCDFLGLIDWNGQAIVSFPVPHGVRARVRMNEDHLHLGAQMGGITVTSSVKMVDFERQIIVTQNNIYDFSSKNAFDLTLIESLNDIDALFDRLARRPSGR